MISYDFRRLKGRMVELGYNQKMLAEKIGISRVSLSKKMNGKCEFTLSELYALIKVLNISNVNYYFFDDVLKIS